MGLYLETQKYMMKCLGFILLIGFISLGAIGGCNNSGGQDPAQALTENDFASDPTLRDNPEAGIVVDFLEPPLSQAPENDTGEVGIDEIPVRYPETVEQTFCWEDDNTEAMHFMELIDSQQNEILRVEVNGECVTEIIEPGNYVMSIHHDGMTETTFPVFIIPEQDDIQQAKETDGLINRFTISATYILKGVQDTITKDSRAQTIQNNTNTLIITKACVSCNLMRADLRGAELSGANLSRAKLSEADLTEANLTDADLTEAFVARANMNNTNLSGADLSKTDLSLTNLRSADLNNAFLLNSNLSGADLTTAFLSGADLTDAKLVFANLTGANLTDVKLVFSDLSGANLRGANLIGADLSGADLTSPLSNLTNAVLSSAIWCDTTCVCATPSIGICVGCAPQSTCTGP